MTTKSTTTATTRTTTAIATTTAAIATFRCLRLQTLDNGHWNTLIRQRFNRANLHAITMFGKGNGLTGATGTTRTTDTVHIVFCLHGQTKVKDVGDAWHVDTTGRHVGGNQHTHLTSAQLLQTVRTHLLWHGTVQRRDSMALLGECIGQTVGFDLGAGKHNGLFQICITQVMVEQLFFMNQIISPMQRLGNLAMTICGTCQFQTTRGLHQTRCQRHDARGKGGREHECLITVFTQMINILQIFSKTQIEHTVSFVNDQCFDIGQMNLTTPCQIQQTTRCRDNQ